MTFGRVVSSVVSCAAVVGCAVVVIGMARASQPKAHDAARDVSATDGLPTATVPTPQPLSSGAAAARPTSSAPGPTAPASTAPASTAPASTAPASSTPASSTPAPRAIVPSTAVPSAPVTPARTTASTAAAPHTAVPHTAAPQTAAPVTRPHTTAAPVQRPVQAAPKPAAPAGSRLPLTYSTGNATRVVTVTASSHSRTTATLQAWTKLADGRWAKYGGAVTAHVGADGIGTASESRSATPQGSFTLTQAFGHDGNPGTTLPYVRTTPSDYWISSPGSRYNTLQRCGSCGYDNGVNEHLYYETPYYDYAVVIDYNTRNAPGGVKQGKGSAFFLHVYPGDGRPTAGCVSIPVKNLVTIMRWLTPSAHPRILIGVT